MFRPLLSSKSSCQAVTRTRKPEPRCVDAGVLQPVSAVGMQGLRCIFFLYRNLVTPVGTQRHTLLSRYKSCSLRRQAYFGWRATCSLLVMIRPLMMYQTQSESSLPRPALPLDQSVVVPCIVGQLKLSGSNTNSHSILDRGVCYYPQRPP